MELILKNEDFAIYQFELEQAHNVVHWMGQCPWDLFLVSSRLQFPLTAEQFLEFVDGNKSDSHRFYSVFQNGRHIGHFEIKNLDWRHKNGTPAHIVLAPAMRGRGLGKKLTLAINQVGFDVLGLQRLSLSVHTVNFAAVAAYTKAGYRFEGVIRDVLDYQGERYSLYQMSILRHEYLKY